MIIIEILKFIFLVVVPLILIVTVLWYKKSINNYLEDLADRIRYLSKYISNKEKYILLIRRYYDLKKETYDRECNLTKTLNLMRRHVTSMEKTLNKKCIELENIKINYKNSNGFIDRLIKEFSNIHILENAKLVESLVENEKLKKEIERIKHANI